MPNRILRDSITESESLSRLTAEEERFFYRLLSKADDYGRFDARPPILRANCFKLMLSAITESQVDAWLRRLADPDIGVVQLYIVAGRPYGEFLHWQLYQRLPRARESKYPQPPTSIIPQMFSSDNICEHLPSSDNICQTCLSDAPVNEDENEDENEDVIGGVNGIGIESGMGIEDEDETGTDAAVVVVDSPDFLDQLTKAYETNIGQVPPGLADEMVAFEANFHPPPEYGGLAVLKAVGANVLSWRYIKAILENWCTQGGPTEKAPVGSGKNAQPFCRGKKAAGADPGRYMAEYVRRRGHLPEARDSPESDPGLPDSTNGEVPDTT